MSSTALLRAVVLEGEAARAAWEQWRSCHRADRIDAAALRLLPALHTKPELCDHLGDFAPEVRRAYLRTWIQNRLLTQRARPLLERLRQQDIPFRILKGAALAPVFYGDWGLRPMGDLDLWVRRRDAERAIGLLRLLGWRDIYRSEAKLKSVLRMVHSCAFQRREAPEIDLHWHALLPCCGEASDEELWAEPMVFDLGGLPATTLSPTGQLFHVCVHGMHPSRQGGEGNYWAADAMAVLAHSGSTIDFEGVVAMACERRLTVTLLDAFRFLRETLDAEIPVAALESLAHERPTAVERLEGLAASAGNPVLRRLLEFWTRYLRLRSRPEYRRPLTGLPRYLADAWGLGHLWQVPAVAAYKLLKNGVKLPLAGATRHFR